MTDEADALRRGETFCREAARATGLILVLTGAGISAESGIPTFRGEDGYWRVGSVNHRPEQLATHASFSRMPAETWRWYLHRRSRYTACEPNAAHRALVYLERLLGDRFLLITQNVDGLHGRAGNSLERSYEIHGNLRYMRCSAACTSTRSSVPQSAHEGLSDDELRYQLSCASCGAWMRPHVLWFDESYDEYHYRFESSLDAAKRADLLIVVGTTGTTNLPNHITRTAIANGASLIVIDPEPTLFTQLALGHERGVHLRGRAGRWLPDMVEVIARALGSAGPA